MPAIDQPANPSQGGDESDPEFLRMPSVLKWTGLARSTIYQLIAHQQFPAQVKLAKRAVGWRRSDLTRWSENCISTPHVQKRQAPDFPATGSARPIARRSKQ